MGNEIYKIENYKDFSYEVKQRIQFFIDTIKYFKKEGSIADVGCGNGYIGKKVSSETIFFDYYPKSKKIIKLDLNNIPLFENKFDNIILSHVLEHFSNPIKILNVIKEKMLSDSGLIFLAVPNVNLINNNYKPYDKKRGHLTVFNSSLLKSIAIYLNLKIIMVCDINHDNFSEIITILKKEN